MIGREVLDEHFTSTTEVELIVVSEIDEATQEKLETLPAEMKNQVVCHYTDTFRSTEANIREGKLTENYRLPELSEFIDDILALAPTFEAIKANAGQPAIEFFERDLTDEQAHATLSGHKLADGRASAGVFREFSEHRLTTAGVRDAPVANHWGVVVLDIAEMPTIRGISKDGKDAIKGVSAEAVIETLKTLPDVTETKDTEVIVAQASPSEAAYCGVQRRRLERGESPLDVDAWTIGKESLNWGGVNVDSAIFRFNLDCRQVRSGGVYRNNAYGNVVVRLSSER